MSTPEHSRTRAEQRAATREALVDEGRRRFARDGYERVVLEQVARGAGLTKGAAYHHFGSKEGLFRAVLERTQRDVAESVTRAADAVDDPWEQLIAGCHAFLRAGSDRANQRIMLIEAPAVLGWNEWRAIDEASSARVLEEGLRGLIDAGVIAEQPIEPLTRLLSGAMNEAALWLAQSPTPDGLDATMAALEQLLAGLRRSDVARRKRRGR